MFSSKIKILILFTAFLITSVLVINFSYAQSNDAIAIRIIPNNEHYSALRWYQEGIDKDKQGSPSQLLVDGYQAVRDGRTVYVNVGNISITCSAPGGNCEDKVIGGECTGAMGPGTCQNSTLYTNIYIMSYTQNADSGTLDIFGQMLNNWTFNTNIIEASRADSCRNIINNTEDDKLCYTDLDCGLNSGLYCNSDKAKVTRDVRRLADLREVHDALAGYNLINGKYVELTAGTYTKGKSLSVWPSWQETLGKLLGMTLPNDPLNSLWFCRNDVDKDPAQDGTCWSESAQKFNNDETIIPTGLGNIGKVYSYTSNDDGTYNLCADNEAKGSVYTSIYDGGGVSNNPACF